MLEETVACNCKLHGLQLPSLILRFAKDKPQATTQSFEKKNCWHGLQIPSGFTLCTPSCLRRTNDTKSWPQVGNYFEKLAPPFDWNDKLQELHAHVLSYLLWHRSTFFNQEGGVAKSSWFCSSHTTLTNTAQKKSEAQVRTRLTQTCAILASDFCWHAFNGKFFFFQNFLVL